MKGTTEYLLYLYAESPVHAGAADSDGVLDLPIQREASTGYPVIWGQSLKGALRQAAADEGWPAPVIADVFGPEVTGSRDGGGLEAGRLVCGDAQLVAMPVATLRRTFAWVTTGPALARLARKYKRIDQAVAAPPDCPVDGASAVGEPWAGTAREVLGPCVVGVRREPDEALKAWAARIAADAMGVQDDGRPLPEFATFADKLNRDLVLVGSDLARPLLSECTEISVRVQLGEGKTVKNGPFHTEYLPTETILAASLTLRAPAASKNSGQGPDDAVARLAELLSGRLHQVGGDETIGKGLVWCHLVQRAGEEATA